MGQVTIGLTVVEPADLGYNTYRHSLLLRNISTGTQIIYGDNGKGIGITTGNASIQLKAGDAINLTRPYFTREIADKWSFVADAASGNLAVFYGVGNISVALYEELFATGKLSMVVAH